MAIEELNAQGGVMGEKITLVTADTGEDVTEGVKAYEYLAETEEVDFISLDQSMMCLWAGCHGCRSFRSQRSILGHPISDHRYGDRRS